MSFSDLSKVTSYWRGKTIMQTSAMLLIILLFSSIRAVTKLRRDRFWIKNSRLCQECEHTTPNLLSSLSLVTEMLLFTIFTLYINFGNITFSFIISPSLTKTCKLPKDREKSQKSWTDSFQEKNILAYIHNLITYNIIMNIL